VFQLIVVDIASSDGSREVLWESTLCRTHFLDQNLGGEAINLALERMAGDLIHISENDQIYLSGWAQHVLECFTLFGGLGQLSLHSVIVGDVFRKNGVRPHNISQHNGDKIKFPDDARLSGHIKELGLLCAWSDRYHVRNLGHEYTELHRRCASE
jgi:hypothetical protein